MKKYWKFLSLALLGTFALTSCEDVPAPYTKPAVADKGDLPYTSTNLKDNWTTYAVTTGYNPWIQGNNYSQATGYQAWDGASTKSNKQVEGYLISPAIKTTSESGKVKFSFDQTLKYTNNDADYLQHGKIYVSKNYDGSDFAAATWEEIPFTPTPSPHSDWTTYSSGEIQLPDEYANQEAVYVAFWFYAPAGGSTTWELLNFKLAEGVAGETSQEEEPPNDTEVTTEGQGTKESPYTVADMNKLYAAKKLDTTKEYYMSGVVTQIVEFSSQYGNMNYYIGADASATETFYIFRGVGLNKAKFTAQTDLAVGDQVVVCGKYTEYSSKPQMAAGNYLYSRNGQVGTETGGETGSETGTTEGISVEGTTLTLTNSAVTAGTTSVTIDLSAQGWANAAEPSTVSFDGGTLAFSVGTGGTTPKFYTATGGVRMYANNTFTITGTDKAIAKAVATCDSYQGTDYVGNTTKTMTINGNTLTLANTHSSNSGGVQLRVKTITVTFAE